MNKYMVYYKLEKKDKLRSVMLYADSESQLKNNLSELGIKIIEKVVEL